MSVHLGVYFEDGPAVGVTLTLKRAPVLLRVVFDPDGTWDALDQLGDGPRPRESIVVYQRVGEAGVAFVDGTDKRGRRCGWSTAIGTYRVVEPQPDATKVREMVAWRAWVESFAKGVAA